MLEQMEAVQPGTSTLRDTASGERTQAQEDQLSKRLVVQYIIMYIFVAFTDLVHVHQLLIVCLQIGSIAKLM